MNTPISGLEKQCKIFPIFKLLDEVVLKGLIVDTFRPSGTGYFNRRHAAELPGMLKKVF